MVLLHTDYLPIQAAERLREFNFWTPAQEESTLVNVLVGGLTLEDQCLRGIIWTPPIPNVDYFSNRNSPWRISTQDDFEVIIRRFPDHCQDGQWPTLARSPLVLLHKVFYSSKDPITVEVTPETLMIDWDENASDPERVLELFSGGYGGWHLASKFLTRLGFRPLKFIGIDWNMNAALQYAITHDACILPDSMEIDVDTYYQINENVVFVQPVMDGRWLKTLIRIRPHYMTISAPCPPWSTGGLLQGLNDEQGLAFLDAWRIARILGPRFVAVEQVAGFKGHDHFTLMLEVAAWAGYDLLLEQVCDLAELCPTKRSRWIAIFRRHDLADSALHTWKKWPKWLAMNPTSFGSQEELPPWEQALFTPSTEVAQQYMDSTLMPGPIRQWSRSEIIQHRVPGPLQKQGTFMAAYGHQHELPLRHLTSKGLFGFFARQGQSFRFFTPWEILLMHLHHGGALLLKPPKISWQILGNMIALPHAVLGLLNMFLIEAPLPTGIGEVSEVYLELMTKRLTISQMTRCQDDMAWYVGEANEASRLQQQLKRLVTQLELAPDVDEVYVLRFPPGTWWHPSHGVQGLPEPEVPPTMPYPINLEHYEIEIKANPGGFGRYHLHAVEPAECIRHLWQEQLLPECAEPIQWQDLTFDTERIVLRPSTLSGVTFQENDILEKNYNYVLIYEEKDIHIYQAEPQETIGHLQSRFPDISPHLFDQRGHVETTMLINDHLLLMSQQMEEIEPTMHSFPWHLLGQVKPHQRCLLDTDILIVTLQADAHVLEKVVPFWRFAFPPAWQRQHGRKVLYQGMGDQMGQFVFRPAQELDSDERASTPTLLLQQILPRHLLDVGLQIMEHDCDGFIPILFKHEDRIVAQILAEDDWQFEDVYCLLQHSFGPFLEGAAPRLVAYGRPLGGECTASHLANRKSPSFPEERTIYKCNIVNPIRGGGPGMGNKNANRQQIQAKLATFFFEYGLSLPQVTTAVDKLLARIALPRLHHLLNQEGSETRQQTFEHLCEECGVMLSKQQYRYGLADPFSTKQMKSTHLTPSDFETDEYLLSDGFFLNEDGTNAAILTTFQPRTTGVCLLTAKQATPWVSANTPLSEDELAMFVVGALPTQINLPHKEITAPAMNAMGRSVLLRGHLLQCGTKAIQCQEGPAVDLTPPKVRVCAISLYKQDYDEKTWATLLNNPVKTTKQLLALHGFANTVGRPWGRSFRQGEGPAPQHLCDQIQFHAEVAMDRFDALLARSGFNGIFVMPKDEQGRPSPEYRIIWTTTAPKSVDTLTAGLAGIAGLVNTKRGHGVRVRREAFSSTWNVLFPDTPEPQEHRCQLQFRVQPFPAGTTKDDIVAWATKLDWKVVPLRTQGAKQWVLGADTHPPPILVWNGHPLISHEIQTRRIDEKIVVAGPRERKVHPQNLRKPFEELRSDTDSLTTESSVRSGRSSVFRSGDPFMDPWANAVASNAPPRATTTAPPGLERRQEQTAAPRPLQGPVANQFQLQEQRISALEQAMGEMRTEQKENFQNTQQQLGQLDQQMQTHQREAKQGFDSVAQAHAQLTEAIRAQDNKLGSAFEELKALFKTNANKRKKPKPFQEQRPDDDSGMDDDDC